MCVHTHAHARFQGCKYMKKANPYKSGLPYHLYPFCLHKNYSIPGRNRAKYKEAINGSCGSLKVLQKNKESKRINSKCVIERQSIFFIKARCLHNLSFTHLYGISEHFFMLAVIAISHWISPTSTCETILAKYSHLWLFDATVTQVSSQEEDQLRISELPSFNFRSLSFGEVELLLWDVEFQVGWRRREYGCDPLGSTMFFSDSVPLFY